VGLSHLGRHGHCNETFWCLDLKTTGLLPPSTRPCICLRFLSVCPSVLTQVSAEFLSVIDKVSKIFEGDALGRTKSNRLYLGMGWILSRTYRPTIRSCRLRTLENQLMSTEFNPLNGFCWYIRWSLSDRENPRVTLDSFYTALNAALIQRYRLLQRSWDIWNGIQAINKLISSNSNVELPNFCFTLSVAF